MENQSYKLSKRAEGYFSTIKEKMMELNEKMESNLLLVKDENQYVHIVINGKQRIQSMVISDLLLNSKDKQEVCRYLLGIINSAIQKSNFDNLINAQKTISVKEYHEMINQEKQSITETIKGMEKSFQAELNELAYIKKHTISDAGNISVVMSGLQQIQLLEIDPLYITSENKNKLINEIIEVVNKATIEIQKEAIDKIKQQDNELLQLY